MELNVNDPDAGKDQGQEEKGVIEDETIVDGITDSMDPSQCCTPGFPVPHQLPEPIQTQVHRVGDAIQPSHPLSSPTPPAFNLSQHQGLYQSVSSSHQVA